MYRQHLNYRVWGHYHFRNTVLSRTLFVLFTLLLTISCTKDKDGERCQLDGNCTGGSSVQNKTTQVEEKTIYPALSCTIVPTQSVVISGSLYGLNIQAKGGNGSYWTTWTYKQDPNKGIQRISFTSSATIYGAAVLANPITTEARTGSLRIADTAGNSAVCSFKITVVPANGYPALACSISPTDYDPNVGENVQFTIDAWGGYTSSYQFEKFYPGLDSTQIDLSSVSGSRALANFSYASAGTASPHILVRNGDSTSWCYLAKPYWWGNNQPVITIHQNAESPSLYASWYRSASDMNNAIIVKLDTLKFSSNSQINFSVDSISDSTIRVERGIYGVPGDPSSANEYFTLRRVDSNSHKFSLVFRARSSDGNQSATTGLDLSFDSSAQNMNCSLEVPESVYAGVEAVFKVRSASGQSLNITSVDSTASPGVRFENGLSPALAKLTFANTGYFPIAVKASSSAASSAQCNQGIEMIALVAVSSGPSAFSGCTVRANQDHVAANSPVRVDVLRAGGTVSMAGYDVQVTSEGNASFIRAPYANGDKMLSLDMKWLQTGGPFKISATMKEVGTGKSFACETSIAVDVTQGLGGKVYGLSQGDSSFLTRYLASQLPCSSLIQGQCSGSGDSQFAFLHPNVDVSARRSSCSDMCLQHGEFSSQCEYPGVLNRQEWFVVEYSGFINIATSGQYEFRFVADDGVVFYLGDKNASDVDLTQTPAIAFDGLHSPIETPSVSRSLSSGKYPIRIRFFQGPGWKIANQFFWKNTSSGSEWSVVPSSVLSH